jgi:Protein of unknown function (DUF1360)
MPSVKPYSPADPKPLGGYAILLLVFNLMVAGIAALFLRSRRRLPEQIPARDIALLSVGTFKLSRLTTKDKVTSAIRAPFTRYQGDTGPAEVSEAARGTGLHRAIGELLACPYSIGQWVATALLAGYLWQPRLIRTAASLFAVVAGADYLQQAWVAVDKAA